MIISLAVPLSAGFGADPPRKTDVVRYAAMEPAGSDAEFWRQARDIFYDALEADRAEREALLEKACAGRPELRAKVDLLLSSLDKPVMVDRDSARSEADPLPERIGRYRVEGRIGHGGMGDVLRARDESLGRTVALKTLRASRASEGDRRRLAREARAASALNHPNIVTIHDFGTDGATDFIAMEFVEGQTLRQAIDAGGTPLETLMGYARQAAAGIAKAHAAGVIHRDLKPGNIMITPEGVVKVLDFGIAKLTAGFGESDATQTALTALGGVLGTPAYMSPEQAAGEAVDERSDIFSFGTILFEMVSGTRPFEGARSLDTLRQVMAKDPPPLRTLNPAVPARLANLIERCLRKDPEQRPPSMADVEAEFAAISASSGPSRDRRSLAALAAVAVLAPAGWFLFRPAAPAPAAVREFAYRIEVQRMKDGQPAGDVAGARPGDLFQGGSRFRLSFEPMREGQAYLVHRSRDGGRDRFWILHPPAGTQTPGTAPSPRTGWLVFDGEPGVENLHVFWSAVPLAELDVLPRTEAVPDSSSPAVRALLDRAARARIFEAADGTVHVQGPGALFGAEFALKHQ